MGTCNECGEVLSGETYDLGGMGVVHRACADGTARRVRVAAPALMKACEAALEAIRGLGTDHQTQSSMAAAGALVAALALARGEAPE